MKMKVFDTKNSPIFQNFLGLSKIFGGLSPPPPPQEKSWLRPWTNLSFDPEKHWMKSWNLTKKLSASSFLTYSKHWAMKEMSFLPHSKAFHSRSGLAEQCSSESQNFMKKKTRRKKIWHRRDLMRRHVDCGPSSLPGSHPSHPTSLVNFSEGHSFAQSSNRLLLLKASMGKRKKNAKKSGIDGIWCGGMSIAGQAVYREAVHPTLPPLKTFRRVIRALAQTGCYCWRQAWARKNAKQSGDRRYLDLIFGNFSGRNRPSLHLPHED